jgi:hypothetical protein
LVSLNRFISEPGESNLPFFKTLKNIINFEWTPKFHKAFEELKYIYPDLRFGHNQEKIKAYFFTLELLIKQSVQY